MKKVLVIAVVVTMVCLVEVGVSAGNDFGLGGAEIQAISGGPNPDPDGDIMTLSPRKSVLIESGCGNGDYQDKDEIALALGGLIGQSLNTTRSGYRLRTMQQSFKNRKGKAKAGGFFENVMLSAHQSFTSMKDGNFNGSGRDSQSEVQLSGMIGDRLELGLGLIHAQQKMRGDVDYKLLSNSVELFGNYSLTDWLMVGSFLEFSKVDLEELMILGTDFGDTFDSWAGGLLLGARKELNEGEVGIITSLTSYNKRSIERLFDNEDTSLSTMVYGERRLNDLWAVMAHAVYYSQLDNEYDMDGYFWVVGADIQFAPSDRVSVSVGYEKTLDCKRLDDDTLNISLSYNF